VEAGEIDARLGHQRGQPRQEIQRLEKHVRGAVAVRGLEMASDVSARGEVRPIAASNMAAP
jgi:predicted nucleic acid-binding Zn ribbon protein